MQRRSIFLSLLLSLLISWIVTSALFLSGTPLFSLSKVQKSIVGFRFKLNNSINKLLAGVSVKKTLTDKAISNYSANTDFIAMSPTIDIVFPTKSLFLRPTSVQPSIEPSTAPVVKKIRPIPTNISLYRPSPTKTPLPTKIPTHVPSPTKSLPRPTTIPTPKVVSYRNPLGLPPPSSKIHDLAVEIGEKLGVPPALILTIMNIETGARFYNRDNAYVEQYSKPGAYMKDLWGECRINSCGAAGPMQMTVGYDSYGDKKCPRCQYTINNQLSSCPANAWNGVVGQVRSLVGSSSVSSCNIRENIYGGAIKMKYDSIYVKATTKYGGVIDTDCAWTIKAEPITNGMKWNMKAVYLTGCHYYGSCSIKEPRLNNKNYCEYLWDNLPPEHKLL